MAAASVFSAFAKGCLRVMKGVNIMARTSKAEPHQICYKGDERKKNLRIVTTRTTSSFSCFHEQKLSAASRTVCPKKIRHITYALTYFEVKLKIKRMALKEPKTALKVREMGGTTHTDVKKSASY